MGVMFSGIFQNSMPQFRAVLSINLIISILFFMFYVYKIVKANPESSKNLTKAIRSTKNAAGSAVYRTGQGLMTLKQKTTPIAIQTGRRIKNAPKTVLNMGKYSPHIRYKIHSAN